MNTRGVGWYSSAQRWFQTRHSIASYFQHHGNVDTDYYLVACGSGWDRIEVPSFVKVVTPKQIDAMAPREMCGSFRCLILRHMMDMGHETVMAFDGDLEFLSQIDDLWELLKWHNAYVTPHRIYPPPLDGRYPTIESLGLSGNYNSGICGFRNTEASRRFVSWWYIQSRDYPAIDGPQCHYAEQGWLRFIGDYLDNVAIVRDQGVNFAWWRCDSETMFRWNGRYEVINVHLGRWEPLRVMHYSHIDFRNLEQIAYCQNRTKAGPGLMRLFEEYRHKVMGS